jgi:hypothetical protein
VAYIARTFHPVIHKRQSAWMAVIVIGPDAIERRWTD